MKLHYFQKGFHYARDGCGNRLIYHLCGCNLHCPWCSNPEGMAFSSGKEISTEELVQEALRCKPMFFDGGGVTFTGGECTCQFDPLMETLAALHAQGIHTAIETNGTSPRLCELLPLLDELIIDCKHYKSKTHRQFTGLGNEQVLQNLQIAVNAHPDVLIRIPLIGGFNAKEADMTEFAALFKRIGANAARIELLPYHEYGKDKWAKFGKTYTVQNAFISDALRERYEAILRESGLTVVRT